MASRIVRYVAPVGATLLFPGTIFADSPSRPHPAAVYAEPKCQSPESKKECSANADCSDTELEKMVMVAREELGPYRDTVMEYVNEGMKHAMCYYNKLECNIGYLRTKAPEELRIGTVAVSGLTGMLLGVRGGVVKKLFLGTLGAAGGAYLAYPDETEKNVKKYSCIAYNFVTGAMGQKGTCLNTCPVARRQAEKRACQKQSAGPEAKCN